MTLLFICPFWNQSVRFGQGVQHWTICGPNNAETVGHGDVLKSLTVIGGNSMKKEELTAIGLSEEVADKVLVIHGKDIEKHKTRITTLEGERDNYKTQLDTANETLKRFDGIDPDKIQEELQAHKTRADEAEKNYNLKLTQREQSDWLEEKLNEYGVSSPYARKQLISEILSEKDGLPWKDGAFLGFDDYMKSAKEKDTGLYQTAEEKAEAEKASKLKDKAASFTGPTGNQTGGSEEKYTPPKIF